MSFEILKKLFLASFLLFGLGIFFASDANEMLNWYLLSQHYTAIKDFTNLNRWLSYLGFFCLYFLVVVFSLPIASLLTLASGAILGWQAAVLVLGAATSGACIVFLAARGLFADTLRKKTIPFINKIEKEFSQNGFSYLLALRLIPLAPFWAVNIVPAYTQISLKQFLITTFLGIIPGTCLYTAVGRSFDSVLAAGRIPSFEALTSLDTVLPLTGLGVLILVPVIYKNWRQSMGNKEANNRSNDAN